MRRRGSKRIVLTITLRLAGARACLMHHYNHTCREKLPIEMFFLSLIGTTWTQEIVWQIINDGKIDYRPLHVRMPWVDGMPFAQPENPYLVTSAGMIEKMFECFPSPRVFKSHLPYDLVPKGCGQAAKPQARYIYVMRNPKDVAVSLFEFVAKVSGREALSWDELFELFYQGKGY